MLKAALIAMLLAGAVTSTAVAQTVPIPLPGCPTCASGPAPGAPGSPIGPAPGGPINP